MARYSAASRNFLLLVGATATRIGARRVAASRGETPVHASNRSMLTAGGPKSRRASARSSS